MRARHALINALLVAMLLAGAAAAMWPTGADAATSFSAVASGEVATVGLRLQPGVLVEQVADPGALVAQASLDSNGSSTAYASVPHPGDLGVTGPPLLRGATGVPVIPDYPLYAASTYPATPNSRVGAGSIVMEADSAEHTSRGVATDGPNRTTSWTSSDDDTGAVVAQAESNVGEVTFGNAVRMSELRTAVKVQRVGDRLERTSELSIGRLTVLDQSFRVTPEGVEIAGQAVPIGADTSEALAAVIDQLAGQGIGLRIVEPIETESGVVSGTVELSYESDIPNYGRGVVTHMFGRTNAAVTGLAGGDDLLDAVSELDTDGGFAVTTPDGFGPSTGALAELPPVASAAPAVDTGPAPAVQQQAGRPPALTVEPLVGTTDETSAIRFYPALVAVSAGLVLVANLFRHFGVKLAWT